MSSRNRVRHERTYTRTQSRKKDAHMRTATCTIGGAGSSKRIHTDPLRSVFARHTRTSHNHVQIHTHTHACAYACSCWHKILVSNAHKGWSPRTPGIVSALILSGSAYHTALVVRTVQHFLTCHLLAAPITEPIVMQTVKHASCGWKHCLALTDKGEVYAWGIGAAGVLGIGNDCDMFSPMLVKGLSGKGMLGVACGLNHSMAW